VLLKEQAVRQLQIVDAGPQGGSYLAQLFGRHQVNELAQRISNDAIQGHLAIVQAWWDDYNNGSLKRDKETSREQQYNNDFFKQILGYVEKPTLPYTLEPKASTQGGQLPDLVLGYAEDATAMTNVAAVVELKGASVDLDRPQQRAGNLTPVQQGFKYKPLYPRCPFVVVSNFYEFRLYHDNQLDFERWTLDQLLDPSNNYSNFKSWYLLLKQPSLTAVSGPSATELLLSDIRTEQETIGRKFYAQYSSARLELLRDLYRRNAVVRDDIDLGIEKAQKIIDRLVFACFAEDKGLLPDNSIERLVKVADSSFSSLWSNLQGFFDAIDKGSDKLGIPSGYNGGLFRRDEVLSSLDVGEEALKGLLALSKYNFNEDLSVTVLGHIFEQSITDLQIIREKVAESKDLELEEVSRRKKDGIFYTPDYVVRHIVDTTLGAYLREAEDKFRRDENLHADINEANYLKREQKAYTRYQEFLQNVRVVDPACGSGAFLVHVFDYLMAENQRVGAVLGNLFSTDDYVRLILKNNIYGVDLNGESVEITQLSLWLKSAKKGEKLTSLEKNIRVGNSLISDADVDPANAFSWESAFPDIMEAGGFDVVVGNPPYGAQVPELQKKHLADHYETYEYQFNSYSLFYERGMHLLKPGGMLGFITPATFTYQHFFRNLRAFLQKYDHRAITKYTYEVFGDADIGDSVAWTIRNSPNSRRSVRVAVVESASVQTPLFIDRDYADTVTADGSYSLGTSGLDLKRISKKAKPLGELADVIVGVKPYQTGKGVPKQTKEDVLTKPFTSSTQLTAEYLPCMIGRDFHRYRLTRRPSMYLKYGKWLAEPRESAPFFASKKIVIRQTADSLIGYLDTVQRINLNNVYNIAPKDASLQAEYLLALINSPVLNYIYQGISQEQGRTFAEVKRVYLVKLPIIVADDVEQKQISDLVIDLLDTNQLILEKTESLRSLLKAKYGSATWASGLDSWWDLDFSGFSKGIGVKLNLAEMQELLPVFESAKQLVSQASLNARTLQADVDRLVADIYGLTEAELALVAGT